MKVLIVSHDAGGAEILSSWCRREVGHEYDFLIEGPAKNIFLRKCSVQPNISPRPPYDLVLTGTSWASDLEKRYILWAKKQAIRVASFLDHWTQYEERFSIGSIDTFPDEIWVGDAHAFRL